MRKAFTLLIFLLSVSAQAQITLTAATSNPLPGDTATFYVVEGNNIYPGDSGAAVVWNYGLLTPADKRTRYYHVPGTVCDPYSSSLAASGTGSCDYYNTSNDSFSIVSIHEPDIHYNYVNNKLVLQYPLTYNAQVYLDSFYRRDSMQSWGWLAACYQKGFQEISSDAYGTLILPDSIYTDVLRVKKKVSAVNKCFFGSGFASTYIEVYEWYSADHRTFLLQVNNIILDELTIAEQTVSEVNIYPNPTYSGILKIELSNVPAEHICLKDVTGKAMQEITALKGTVKYEMDVSSLARGIYFLEVSTTQGTLVRKIQIL